jgi:hypothetical protein
MELVHAKMARGSDMFENEVYQTTFVFGSPIKDVEGKSIGKAKPVHMTFMNGMPPEAFIIGLRALADHVEKEFNLSDEGET